MKPPSPLVTAAQLRAALGRPGLVLLDASFDLADPAAGERAFALGHVPGARHVHLEHELSAPKRAPGAGFTGRHPLPERAAFAETVGSWGVAPQTCVVAMDRQDGAYAARLWWMLRWLGHARVWVLDGGVPGWAAEGGTLTDAATAPIPARAPYPLRRGASLPTVCASEVARCLGRATLLDARAGARFRGDVEPLDRVAGHIPGALNRFYKDNLDAATGRFKAAPQLAREFADLFGAGAASAGDVVHLCGSGVTACHNLLAMAAAGLPAGALYPGSWSEWSADPARPVARGD